MMIKNFLQKFPGLIKFVREAVRILMLPIMIPVGMVMNARKKRLTPLANKSDSIGVLCRGVSLARAGELDFLDDFLIVNTRSVEMKAEPVKSLLLGKRIIHMVNVGEGVLPFWYLLKYQIYRYTISRLSSDGSEEGLRSPRKIYRTEKFGLKTEAMPDRMEPYLEGASNTGVIAVAFAAVGLKKKHVYIAGMDFYETPYMTGPLQTHETNLATEARDKMINYIIKLAQRCPETTFHFLTASSYNFDLPNIKIHQEK